MTVPQSLMPTPTDPVAERPGWSAIAPAVKRERIIEAAVAVFARHGLEAPMHEVAAAAGAGVASIYRIFPSKHDLWAAIVIRRLDEIAADFAQALEQPGRRWPALAELVRGHVERQSPEPFFVEARAIVEDRPEVAEAIVRATHEQQRLLDAVRAEGRLRADATVEDLHLLYAATRAARRISPASVARMLELMLDALQAPRG